MVTLSTTIYCMSWLGFLLDPECRGLRQEHQFKGICKKQAGMLRASRTDRRAEQSGSDQVNSQVSRELSGETLKIWHTWKEIHEHETKPSKRKIHSRVRQSAAAGTSSHPHTQAHTHTHTHTGKEQVREEGNHKAKAQTATAEPWQHICLALDVISTACMS